MKSVTLVFPPGSESFKVWIFCESLSRLMTETKLGELSMADADAVKDRITVSRIHGRKLRRVKKQIEQLLQEHYLSSAQMTESSDEQS